VRALFAAEGTTDDVIGIAMSPIDRFHHLAWLAVYYQQIATPAFLALTVQEQWSALRARARDCFTDWMNATKGRNSVDRGSAFTSSTRRVL
jgi:hypothetical protein